MAKHMLVETLIYIASRNRKLLKFSYDGVERLVEPYSYRDRGRGKMFYGYCLLHGSIHSFKIDQIKRVTITDQDYKPRWPVEI